MAAIETKTRHGVTLSWTLITKRDRIKYWEITGSPRYGTLALGWNPFNRRWILTNAEGELGKFDRKSLAKVFIWDNA